MIWRYNPNFEHERKRKIMYSLTNLQEIINTRLAEERIGRKPYALYDPMNYSLETGGKRVRPVLVLMACNMFSEQIDHAIKPAIGLEIFHNFTLLHDDIMDHANIRRGKPTVHKKWNENTAILSGDAMFIKAYEYFLDIESPYFRDILKIFNNTALEVCEGQQFDMEFEQRADVTEKEYLRMIELKTSVLLAAALKIGAFLGGAKPKDADLLYEFGRNVGLAFQLQDDYLDVYGDTAVFGKQIGGDIVANKKTFMLIKALQLADKETKKKLEALLILDHANRESKVSAVMEIYNKLNIKELVNTEISQLNKKAKSFLNLVAVHEAKKQELMSLSEKLISRVN